MSAKRLDHKIERGVTFSRTVFMGQGKKSAIISFEDAGSGRITVNAEAHGLADAARVIVMAYDPLTNVNYTGSYTVADAATDSFTIAATWQGDVTGGHCRPAFDLTGYSGRAMIREDYDAASETVSFTVTIPDEPGGVLTYSVTSAQAAALTSTDKVWDLEIESAGGIVTGIYYGVIHVRQEATK